MAYGVREVEDVLDMEKTLIDTTENKENTDYDLEQIVRKILAEMKH